MEEIFEKRLFFLIPFHIFTYEKNFPEYESNEEKLQELKAVYRQIIRRLNDYAEAGIISEYEKGTVIAMSKKVLEALTVKYSKVQEGVGKVMGGKILDYEAKDILNKGRAEGRVEHLVSQVKRKLEKGDAVEKIADDLLEDIAVIKEIVAELQKR